MRYGERECVVIHACVEELAVCLPLYENDLLQILEVLDGYHETWERTHPSFCSSSSLAPSSPSLQEAHAD